MYGQKNIVSHTSGEGSFGLVTSKKTSKLVLDPSDFEGVNIAAKNFQKETSLTASRTVGSRRTQSLK